MRSACQRQEKYRITHNSIFYMAQIPHLTGRCHLHIFDTKEDLDCTLRDICIDVAVNGKISTAVFATDYSDIEFGRLFIDYFGENNIQKVTAAPLAFKNVETESFEGISDSIRSCAANGCKLVILEGGCVKGVDRYDSLAEELSIAMLAIDINHNK